MASFPTCQLSIPGYSVEMYIVFIMVCLRSVFSSILLNFNIDFSHHSLTSWTLNESLTQKFISLSYSPRILLLVNAIMISICWWKINHEVKLKGSSTPATLNFLKLHFLSRFYLNKNIAQLVMRTVYYVDKYAVWKMVQNLYHNTPARLPACEPKCQLRIEKRGLRRFVTYRINVRPAFQYNSDLISKQVRIALYVPFKSLLYFYGSFLIFFYHIITLAIRV